MLNMMKLKKVRSVSLLERCVLTTAFTDAIRLLQYPSFNQRIAEERGDRTVQPLWFIDTSRDAYELSLLKLLNLRVQRLIIRSRCIVVRIESTFCNHRCSYALGDSSAKMFSGQISNNVRQAQIMEYGGNITHSILDGDSAAIHQHPLAQKAILVGLIELLVTFLDRQHLQVAFDCSFQFLVAPVILFFFDIHTIAEG